MMQLYPFNFYKGTSLSLCYLYSKSSSYPHMKELLDAFENSLTIDIDTVDDIDDYDIYVIDLNSATKEISKKLVSIFKKKESSLVYFIIPKGHTLLLFQLTYLLNTQAIITHTQDINKIISNIKTEHEAFVKTTFESWLGKTQINTNNFIVYKKDQIAFISEPLLSLLECDDNDLFETKILSKIDMEKLLQDDTTISTSFLSNLNIDRKFIFKSSSVSKSDKIIYVEHDEQKQKKLDFMSSRVTFIELLKENILQRNISHKELSLFTISISNMKSMLSQYSVVEIEDILLDMLVFMESILEEKLIFSQFENNFYVVLFEGSNFEKTNTMADHFNTKVLNYIDSKNNNTILDLFTFNIKEHELSTILTTLSEIKNGTFRQNETTSTYIKHLRDKDYTADAKSLLDNAFIDKQKFKILNIYKGLVVNTSAKIVKTTDEYIYISFEPLQGVILDFEKRTVLQSDNFAQDIYAEVKQINLGKKIAILENFKFLKTNANSREYARVTTSIKMPIQINMDGRSAKGIILDISIKSIAIQVKHNSQVEMLEVKNASLVFNIEDKSIDIGYRQLNIPAKVTVVTGVDKTNHYKVVCDLDQDSHDLDVVLKFVYERQKELIVELKKMSKLN